MKLEYKIYWSVGLTVLLTIAYYFVYVFVDLHVSKLCDKYICFEFPPYADVLSIWVAIIGLYFVVSSLDAWKQQDKYNNAKIRIAALNDMNKKITLGFGLKMNSFYDYPKPPGENERRVLVFDTQREYVVNKFNAYLEDTNIFNDIRKLEYENTHVKNCLYQSDFDFVIQEAYSYISNCVSEIKHQSITEDDSRESYQNNLTQIYRKNSNHEQYFKQGLNDLNEKLNNFIN